MCKLEVGAERLAPQQELLLMEGEKHMVSDCFGRADRGLLGLENSLTSHHVGRDKTKKERA